MKKLLLLICIIGYSNNTNAQCDGNLPITENFDSNTIGVCWNVEDMDGDGWDWYWRDYGSFYGGHKCLTSRSWNSTDLELFPDNWIYSYAINLTSFNTSDNIELSWKVRGEMASRSHEYYTVYAATDNQIAAFESSPVKRGEYADEVGAAGTFVSRSLNISSLAGNMVYIAFRHHNSSDQLIINIDDVSISTSSVLGIEDFNKDNFKYYYNSNDKSLTLTSSNMPINSVKVYNLLGQNIINKKLSNTSEYIDLSDIIDGIYIAQVEINNSTKAIKFLKK